MKNTNTRQKSKGFTLIELIITMVIMAIGAVAVTSMVSNIFKNRQSKRDTSVNTQLAQECAELVLAQSRANYANIATTDCSAVTLTGYASPTLLAVTSGSASSSASSNWSTTDWAACPYSNGSNCTLLKISSGGQSRVALLLVSH